MAKITGSKTQNIPIGDTNDCYLSVNFDYEIIKYPTREEDFHGGHWFNEDEINYSIQFIQLFIANSIVEKWDKKELDIEHLSSIESLLTIED